MVTKTKLCDVDFVEDSRVTSSSSSSSSSKKIYFGLVRKKNDCSLEYNVDRATNDSNDSS